jgi:murein DD-endopeptidase MepM/ murein hydrolase activator NlpD
LRTKIIILILILLSFCRYSFAFLPDKNSGAEKSNSDTVQAIVVYGNRFLIDPKKYDNEEELISIIDSLLDCKKYNSETIKELSLFLSIRNKKDSEVYKMIDSLFELPKVPYALINQINYYLAIRNPVNEEISEDEKQYTFFEMEPFPSHFFYNDWNTQLPHPYTDELTANDTSFILQLVDKNSYCNYHHPFPGPVTSQFGWRDKRMHYGIDIGLNTGDPVKSAFEGMVRFAKKHGGYGNVVIIRHYNGLETVYAHLHKIKVKPGQIVEAGQVIGTGGNTGRSFGSHLHFEVRFKGKPINPNQIISFKNQCLHSDVIVLEKTKKNTFQAFPENAIIHEVEPGETLSIIAQKYGTSTKKLRELNQLSSKAYLRKGQKLRVE